MKIPIFFNSIIFSNSKYFFKDLVEILRNYYYFKMFIFIILLIMLMIVLIIFYN